jgi:hypothetical protein
MWVPGPLTTLWTSTACYRDIYLPFPSSSEAIQSRYLRHRWIADLNGLTLQPDQLWKMVTCLNKGEMSQYIWLKKGLGRESLYVTKLEAIPFCTERGSCLGHSCSIAWRYKRTAVFKTSRMQQAGTGLGTLSLGDSKPKYKYSCHTGFRLTL